ncbi:MAG: AmmeMemoRadiSam system radical SAM enzyme [Candidatus Rifleibacteriota bacterium]
MRKAEFFQKQEDGSVKCLLCPNFCIIKEGENGRCLSRGVRGGEMRLLNYAVVVAENLDPIEKKPLYHYYPGGMIFSIGSYGCNLKCRFCQNSDISQFEQPGKMILPDKLVQRAFHQAGNLGVAFTYNEPGIWYEYLLDCIDLLKKSGLKAVLVTNGYLCNEPFSRLCEVSDAMNIDLKAFSPSFYKNVCQGDLETVKRNITTAVRSKTHVELTNLVVTGLNDDENEFRRLVEWVAQLSDEIPLHISRYFPRYLETAQATDPQTIARFVEIAQEKLKYVYAGNIGFSQNTICPACKKTLIERTGYHTRVLFSWGKCSCGQELPIII